MKFDLPKQVKEKDNEDDSDCDSSQDEEEKEEQKKVEKERVKKQQKMKSFKFQKKDPKQVIDEATTVQELDLNAECKDERDSETPEAGDDNISVDRCTNPMSSLMDRVGVDKGKRQSKLVELPVGLADGQQATMEEYQEGDLVDDEQFE